MRGLLPCFPCMVTNTSASVPADGLSLVHSSKLYHCRGVVSLQSTDIRVSWCAGLHARVPPYCQCSVRNTSASVPADGSSLIYSTKLYHCRGVLSLHSTHIRLSCCSGIHTRALLCCLCVVAHTVESVLAAGLLLVHRSRLYHCSSSLSLRSTQINIGWIFEGFLP